MKKIQPLGKNILVEIVVQEKVTDSGIVLPDTASEEKPQEGKVVAVGDSEKINENIKKDSLVIFAKYSGTEIEIDKKEYLILKSEDILAVVN